jgi:hypothetical protein
MFRPIWRREAFPRTVASLVFLLVAAAVMAGCGDDDPPTAPDTPAPVAKIDTFGLPEEQETLTKNGARTHAFTVEQTGSVSATLTSLGGEEGLVVGLSLGTWNGESCQIIIANDKFLKGTSAPVSGTANGTGNFCVRIYDVGKLTGDVGYSIAVTHY